MLKSYRYGGWGVVVGLVIVSAPVPFWVTWGWNWVGLGWDWVWVDLGLKGWGLGLENMLSMLFANINVLSRRNNQVKPVSF